MSAGLLKTVPPDGPAFRTVSPIDWPWTEPTQTVEQTQTLADQCSVATLAITDAAAGKATSRTVEVLDLFRKGNFADAVTLYRKPQDPNLPPLPSPDETIEAKKDSHVEFESAPTSEDPEAPIRMSDNEPRGFVPWMARRPRVFAAAASVIVVSLVGLQLQYLDAANFAGELGDWLGLLLWSAVVELSGVSVLDVLGRLGTGNVRVGSPPARGVGPAKPQDGARGAPTTP